MFQSAIGIALLAHLDHLLQRRADDRAAGLAAVEELLLVDLAAASWVWRMKTMSTRSYLRFRNRCSRMKKRLARSFSRSPIEAETSIRQNITALARGTMHRREAVVAHVDRIDEGNRALQALQPLDLGSTARRCAAARRRSAVGLARSAASSVLERARPRPASGGAAPGAGPCWCASCAAR